MRDLPSGRQFNSLCSIFSWWCQTCSLYPKEGEVPSLFLLQLVTTIEELVSSNKLVIIRDDDDDNLDKVQCNGKKKNKKKIKPKNHAIVHDVAQEGHSQMNGEISNNEKSSLSAENNHIDGIVEEMSDLIIDKVKTTKNEKSTDDSSERHRTHMNSSAMTKGSSNTVNSHSKCVSNSEKIKSSPKDEISITHFKKQIANVSVTFLKLIPPSNLSSSIASKLKNLHQI